LGHFGFLSIFLFFRNIITQAALKIAVNSRGGNAAESVHFRHRIGAESPRNRFRDAA
jgi:quinol-cytochrome oxidoreductase complex cytochrome b subunit